jgi:hypothetical protein
VEAAPGDAQPRTISFPFTVAWSINYGFPHELHETQRHIEAKRWRDALFAAHRAWNFYGDWVLFLLGESKRVRRELRRNKSTGFHRPEARKLYHHTTGDTSLAGDPARWERLRVSVDLRHDAEHNGRPVDEAQAREGLAIRLELMRHIDAGLRNTPAVDVAMLDRAPLPPSEPI